MTSLIFIKKGKGGKAIACTKSGRISFSFIRDNIPVRLSQTHVHNKVFPYILIRKTYKHIVHVHGDMPESWTCLCYQITITYNNLRI